MYKILILLMLLTSQCIANQKTSDPIFNDEINRIIKEKRVEDFKSLIRLWKITRKWNSF